MFDNKESELRTGFETAYIDGSFPSNLAYKPQFISNDYKEGRKVLSSIEDELLKCDKFQISVAFITESGLVALKSTLRELEKRNIPGEILTTNYLGFSEPKALKALKELKNIKLKMFDVKEADQGFHTKGYIFQKEEIYRIIIGSSNLTSAALTKSREWNTKLISTKQGEMVQEIVSEFNELWDSKYSYEFDDFYEEYKEEYEIRRHQRELAGLDDIVSYEKYSLKPNKMQTAFMTNLRRIVSAGEDRALLISATGTGKTYASAFAMRELGYKRVLFLVHREELAWQTKKAYKNVFSNSISMGVIAGKKSVELNKGNDYIFATVQTMCKEHYMKEFKPDDFDCIILDEAHHSSADSYQEVMNYFDPQLWLGMTATPDRRDDNEEGRNIYEIFNYQIAYEIRLQQAMEENMLCPFHYFGISDISVLDEKQIKEKKLNEEDFNKLIGNERVKNILSQAEYYGYSGDRVKGLIFCSRVDETKALSEKFNKITNPKTGKKYRTVALNGDASQSEREDAFERLAMNEAKATKDCEPLDYIFSVEILNEGVDIVEVNQVIMLRPTKSPIVFVQQLGRGLRKAVGKEYVVILDFIGNYNTNFMIPIALSGDRSYNPDTIRKYVVSGNNIIPGASTIHFDEVAKEKIFESIDKISGMKTIIKESYTTLKNRLGRVPYLFDFYDNGEIDPLVIIKEYKTYNALLKQMEKESYTDKMSEEEITTLEYLSRTIIGGVRPYELEILKRFMTDDVIYTGKYAQDFKRTYGYDMGLDSYESAVEVLKGNFVSKKEELIRYSAVGIVEAYDNNKIKRSTSYAKRLKNEEFRKQVDDIIKVGLRRYDEKYCENTEGDTPFVLYEKYYRKDVCLLMNEDRDLSSTMFGMKRINDDVFVFVTYHKGPTTDENNYLQGKPDYADAFEDNITFRWDSQIKRGIDSSYVENVRTAQRKHLFIKKSDAEDNFYYVGEFDVSDVKPAKKRDNRGKEQDITKFEFKMQKPVKEDLLKYLQTDIEEPPR